MDCFAALLPCANASRLSQATAKVTSNPGRLLHGFDSRQRRADDRRLERAQALVDREQVDDRGPGVDQYLERVSHLRERIQDLLHRTQRELAGNDRRRQQDVGEDDVGLQIDDAADVEVQVVQIEPEIVLANVLEQLT